MPSSLAIYNQYKHSFISCLSGLLILILMWPNSLIPGGSDVGKRISTAAMIFSGFAILSYFAKSIRFNFNILTVIFWSLISYLLLRNIAYFIFENGVARDIAETIRVIGLGAFFLLGQRFAHRRNLELNIHHLYIYLFLIFGLVFLWVLFNGRPLPGYDMYITRGSRFSGVMASVNYVWAPVILLVGILYWFNRSTNILKNKNTFLIFSTVFFLSVLQIIFSGSRGSIVAILVALVIAVLVTLSLKNAIRVALFIFTVIGAITLFGDDIYQALYQYDQNIKRVKQLMILITNLGFEEITQIHSFNKRMLMWQSASADIMQRIYFGHGPSKSGWGVLDNTYLMSIYRYGIIGLFLELLFYICIIFKCLKNLSKDWVPFVIILFLPAYILSGLVGAVFYELKLPYILALLAGSLASSRPAQALRK